MPLAWAGSLLASLGRKPAGMVLLAGMAAVASANAFVGTLCADCTRGPWGTDCLKGSVAVCTLLHTIMVQLSIRWPRRVDPGNHGLSSTSIYEMCRIHEV